MGITSDITSISITMVTAIYQIIEFNETVQEVTITRCSVFINIVFVSCTPY